MNISPSCIFLRLLLLERYHWNCQAVLADAGMCELIYENKMGHDDVNFIAHKAKHVEKVR